MVTMHYFKNQISRQLQWLVVLSILLILGFQANAQNIIQIDDASVTAGGQVTISIGISNADPFVGFQLDIPLPGAVSYVNNSAALDNSRSNGHSLSASVLNENTLRIIAFSINNTPFNGNSGTVATFELNAGNVPGTYGLLIQNAMIASASSANILTGTTNGSLTIQAPNIQVNPASDNFGSIPLGGTSERSFTVENTGNQSLSITAITFDNAYFENLGSSSFSLSPGQSQTVSVRFSAVVKGTYNNTMSIQSNDPDQPETTIGLEAIAFAVNELHTGNMEAASGTQADLSFTINNMEDFVGFQFDLSLPTPLTYVDGSGSLNADRITDHQLSVSMVSSTSLRVIGLSTTNTPFSGDDGTIVTLSFAIDGTGGWYPLNISGVIIGDINGDNVVSASTNGSLTITAPDIHANSSLGFGEVAVNATADQSFTIYNYGQETLTISNITFTNPVFSNLSALPITIPSSQSSQIELHFDPTSSGQSSGTMRIYSDDPDENPFNVSLTANAFSPNYMSVANLTTEADTTVWLDISVENYDEFVGFQVDVLLPAGITYVGGSAFLNEDRKQDHNLSITTLENGGVRLLAFSMEQLPFLEMEGTVVSIALLIEEGLEEGIYPVVLENAVLGNSNSENILYGINNGEITIEIIPEYSSLELSFGQGYTWFSVNVNPGSMTPTSLFTELAPCYDDRIIGQTSFALYTGTNWIGSLTQLGMGQSYRMKLCSTQQLSLMGEAAAFNPIILNAGYTWLGYQPQECQPVNEALAGLNPGATYDDRLIGQNSFALYTGNQWIGSLTQMCPGAGYVIRLANGSTLTYAQPAANQIPSKSTASSSIKSPTGILPDYHMQHSMMVVAKLELHAHQYSLNPNDVVYAYIDGEVRGMMHPDSGEDGLIFLSIGSNEETSQEITFRVWLDELQQLQPLNETLTFEPLAAIGELNNPFIFTLGEMVGLDETNGGSWIGEPYPNPFNDRTTVPFYLAEADNLNYKIIDSRGVQIRKTTQVTGTKGHQQFDIESTGLAKGIYLLVVTVSNQNKMIRLIIN
jgi:hypothetical protein